MSISKELGLSIHHRGESIKTSWHNQRRWLQKFKSSRIHNKRRGDTHLRIE